MNTQQPAREPGVYWVRYCTFNNGDTTYITQHIAQYCMVNTGKDAGKYVWYFIGKTEYVFDDYFTEIGPKIELPESWKSRPKNYISTFGCGCKVIVYDERLNKETEVVKSPGCMVTHDHEEYMLQVAKQKAEAEQKLRETHS